jgi:uncharacterized cupin superfamily protein
MNRFNSLCLSLLIAAPIAVADNPPAIKRLTMEELETSVFAEGTERLEEESETGKTPALDRLWHKSPDGCMQTGVYQTGRNRYTVDEPYPYDELMVFIEGGVTLTASSGAVTQVGPGDVIMMPQGWQGIWDSEGYRKIYVIYDCED